MLPGGGGVKDIGAVTIDIDAIRDTLRAYRAELRAPSLGTVELSSRQAAVAMILRGETRRPEVLFIERARRDGDPWSGHMAFPGGRIESGDRDLRAAAERETREEVGLSLEAAENLGRLDDLEGRRDRRGARLVVSAFVYHLAETAPLSLSAEVETALWVPLSWLHEPRRRVDYVYELDPSRPRFPGIRVSGSDRHVVWGLTYRFLERFCEILGQPIADGG
jgi:8-oxo-dGTP pyrophosphatase MutT (NUDIX family)